MKIKIYDNVLLPEQHETLYNSIYHDGFPWMYSVGKTYPEENIEDRRIFQFTHEFYSNHSWTSPRADILDPILKMLNPLAIIRIKANLTTITPTKLTYKYHRDMGFLSESKTALYYVNTNNGETVFSNGDVISSVANRLIVFDSNMLHAGTSCTDESTRCVINFNFFNVTM